MRVYNDTIARAVAIVALSTFGGSGILATELGVALAKRGWQIHFISSAPPARLSTDILADEVGGRIHLHQVGTTSYPVFTYQPYALALAGKIAEVADEHKIKLIHAHYAIPHTISALLAGFISGGKIKVITTLHGTDITTVGVDSTYKRITTYAIENSDAVTAVSKWLIEETRKRFDYKGRIHLIYNFVNPACFRPNHPQAENVRRKYAGEDEYLLIHVSNFRPVKRAPLAVEILARVSKKLPARLLMVGEGADRSRAAELAEKLGVADKVTFLDNVFNLAPYLSASDLMILPSLSESFGLAALESMACGTPVVATRIGGLPEVIDDGVDGILIEPDDMESMVEACIELLSDADRLASMSELASKKPESRFNYEKLVGEYENLYLSLLG